MDIKLITMEKETKKMIAKLNKMGKAGNNKACDIVKQCTGKLDELVVERMPVDEAMLEGSTKTKVLRSNDITDITGYVFIPANSAASDYALFMHEMEYKIGKRSQDKEATTGIKVGRKYMERALTDGQHGFSTFIFQQLKGFIDNAK